MADEEPSKDNAVIQEFMTAYLYAMYTFKGGRFPPAEAIRHMLGFAAMAERANGLSIRLMSMLQKK
jgi:hypothetical protein